MITIRDVAREADVSVATVSRVMNNTAKVNDETREKILGVMQELNYTPSAAARNMRFKRTPAAEMILFGDNMSEAEVYIYAAREEAERQGWEFRSFIVPPSETALHSFLKLYDAPSDIKFIFVQDTAPELLALLRERVDKSGIILVGNTVLEGYSCVLREERAGMRKLTRRLLDEQLKRIAYVGSVPAYLDGIKFTAFAETLEQAGKNINPKLLYSGGSGIKDGADAAKALLQKGNRPPGAVVFESEAAAFGFAQYCVKENLPFSHKIRLAAFGSGEYAAYSALPVLLCGVRKKQLKNTLQAVLRAEMQEMYRSKTVSPIEMKLKEYL